MLLMSIKLGVGGIMADYRVAVERGKAAQTTYLLAKDTVSSWHRGSLDGCRGQHKTAQWWARMVLASSGRKT